MPELGDRDTVGDRAIDRFGASTPPVFSLNAPVPGKVSALATELRSALLPAEQLRDDLTLVVKRLPATSWEDYLEVERAVRRELADQPPVRARIDGVATFDQPPAGAAPVLYLSIESHGLQALHQRLADRFGAADGIEGDAYVPHITLARGSGADIALEQVRAAGVPTVEWTIERLVFYNAHRTFDAGAIVLDTERR